MSLFLFFEQALEPVQMLLHIAVDLKVPRDNCLHFVYVLVDVALLALAILVLQS